ncbi:Adenylate cyclase (EC [Olavius sp. associated proteobacterium Delta 1]|nr:Adenylate cyclase (EC [Olavius sp. associated proteobacterium Delta 1]
MRLPERVVRATIVLQNASERLVGWFQLTFLILFGSLYAVAPKAVSSEKTYEILPWFLVVYLLLTVIRLIFAYRGRIPEPLLYVSVIIDMGLLLGMIWTFHIQYQQPPSFYLKAPTLLYVFIFISLRALRFEARFVIVAGIVAAAGWMTLTAYSIFSGGGMNRITHDYVHYMKFNSILIGAEFEKIVIIITVTAILALAINRAQKLLVSSVAEETAVRDLSRFFSPEIARQITASEHEISVGKGQLRETAILMVDIRGFTRLASVIQPDDLICLLADYQAKMVPIIQSHGGTIDKFLGDGIMATFGAAVISETFAADALNAVDAVMTAADNWSADLQADKKPLLKIGAAVTTGQVIFGAVGDASRMEYTVIGDAVNMAAKLEKHTKSEGVHTLCTASAYETARKQGYRPPVERKMLEIRNIEGVIQPQDIVILAL